MALLEVRTEWAVYKNCFLQVAKYQADNSRAIEIWNEEDGPIARITVCIPEVCWRRMKWCLIQIIALGRLDLLRVMAWAKIPAEQ